MSNLKLHKSWSFAYYREAENNAIGGDDPVKDLARCGAEIPAEHKICTGCKKQSVFFEEFCEGLRSEWTLGKCEAARAEAKRKWREKEAVHMGRR